MKAYINPLLFLKSNLHHDKANNANILRPTKNVKMADITTAIMMVMIHITRALSQNVSYMTFIIRRLTTMAIISPTIQIPNQAKIEIHAEKVISNSIVVPKAVSSPSSSSNIIAVKYNGREMNIKSRTISTINTTISKPHKAILMPLNFLRELFS